MSEIENIEIEDDGLGDDALGLKGIALIDADTIAYIACLDCEVAEEQLPEEFHTTEEWKEILEHPGYDADTHTIYTTDERMLMHKAEARIQDILFETQTKSAELHFSSGRNFRFDVLPAYKGNRKTLRYPTGLAWLKQELHSLYEGSIATQWEADDIVVYKKHKEPEKYVLCALDKDVLRATPGKHFDTFHRRMHFIENDIEGSTKWPFLQTLIGDTADNIKGVKGIGPKKADKLLEECILPCECWEVVVQAYLAKGMTKEEAIQTMQVVWMHSLKEINGELTVQLWTEPCEVKE